MRSLMSINLFHSHLDMMVRFEFKTYKNYGIELVLNWTRWRRLSVETREGLAALVQRLKRTFY